MKKSLFFLLLSNFLLAQWSIPDSERNALLSVYNDANGANWSITWDLKKDPKYWYGVKINNKHVTKIHLKGNALSDAFPTGLSALSYLQDLDLSENQLSGEVPSTVSSLTTLKNLYINDNKLSGDPSATISVLSGLEALSLGNNNFEIADINQFLENFKTLKVLNLANFGLIEVPQKISDFSDLEILDLSNNQISENFSGLSGLAKLEELNLSGNQLSKIPSDLSSLSGLKVLNLANNQFQTDYASSLSALQNLEWLSLKNNQISTIPSELAHLSKLIHLNLSGNQLSGGFSQLISNSNLQQVFLDFNKISGSFPSELTQLPKLQMLSLIGNELTGSIPENIPPITYLDNNRFTETQIFAFLELKKDMVDFSYSPQRFDEPETILTPLGSSTKLKQSLSGENFSFTWFKNLSEDTGIYTQNYNINEVQEEDYSTYTCEAYFLKKYTDFVMEVSFFREPITLDKNTLSTDEILKGLAIYPNPAKDFLNIKSENYKINKSYIYDMSGKLIMESSSQKIDIRILPSGGYILLINTDNGLKTFKWIKQ